MRIRSALVSVTPFFAFTIFFLKNSAYAQTLSSAIPGVDIQVRRTQLHLHSDSLTSFCIRPLHLRKGGAIADYWTPSGLDDSAHKPPGVAALFPIEWQHQVNTHHPYGWNDGSMIPAKGYQTRLSFGFYARKGLLSIQLRPELVYAQNSGFSTFPEEHTDSIWRTYYNTVLNNIDAPEQFGRRPYTKIFAGQSSVRLHYRKLSLGISSENLWWGPGIRNSLLMSNNAPGFPHLTIQSDQPLVSAIGSFEFQVIGGWLKGSGFLPDTTRRFDGERLYKPKEDDDRYLNGMVFTWQPKWTKGLFVGVSRVFYQYMNEVPTSLDGFLPVIGKFFKRGLASEDEKRRDQMISFFFRLALPKEKAEVYGEYGRNDHSHDVFDFLAEPEHSRAYILGFSKAFAANKKDVEIFAEIANLTVPNTIRLRAQESWYGHYQVRHGYTHKGQVVGAGIGPGGASQTFGLQWHDQRGRTGGTLERVVRNNDFYYSAFVPLQNWKRHWVDLSLNLNKSWLNKNILYDIRVSGIYSLNHQWYRHDIFHLSAQAAIAYLF